MVIDSFPISEASERAVALAQAGAAAEAFRLLEAASVAGDGVAAATLADWRMTGQIIRRDLAAARALYGRALELGLEAAAGPYIALLASGAGGTPRDWRGAIAMLAGRRQDRTARRQARLLAAMDLTETGDPRHAPQASALHEAPRVARIPALLTRDECGYLIDLATPRLQLSQVVDPRSGRLIHDPIRTARAAAFAFVMEDPVLHAINRRIAAATGTCWAQGEPAQVLCYRPGEEYRLHSDALPAGSNQRAVTVLVALNRDYDGGETHFPALDLAWRGRTGEALVFRNVDSAGTADPTARHAGMPPRRGTKFLLSRWIREHPLDLSGPPGRPL
jgi:prolyl 4-hydroxylase